jgi:cytochrome c553
VKECVPCHGATGRGDGPKAPDLKVNPGDLSSAETLRQTDGALFWKLTRGRTPMPAYRARFSDQERWMIVHYMRTLGREEPRVPAPPAKAAAESRTAPEPTKKPSAEAQGEIEAGPYVSRQEYQKLKAEHDELKRELEALKVHMGIAAKKDGAPKPSVPEVATAQESIDRLEKELEEAKDQAKQSASGTTKFLLSGFAFGDFTSRRHEDSSFSAGFAPLFLWKLSDRILLESELDVSLDGSETDVDLERAQIYYLVNDYLTLGVGKFLSPMNFLEDHLHQVNKLPDKPLAIRDLLPETNLGLQLRGAIPIRATKLGYAFYVANAPTIETQQTNKLGTLQFDNFDNHGGHVAVGGRVGFYPISELEVGYGFQFSSVEADGQRADALLHSVDLNYVRDSAWLKGTVNLLAQWAWSAVDPITYDPDGSLGFGPVRLDDRRNGGYVQLAYRPTRINQPVVNRLEPIVRYERFNQSGAVAGFDEQRWTIGLNYWLLPNAVVKGAYEFSDRSGEDAFLFQFKVGF